MSLIQLVPRASEQDETCLEEFLLLHSCSSLCWRVSTDACWCPDVQTSDRVSTSPIVELQRILNCRPSTTFASFEELWLITLLMPQSKFKMCDHKSTTNCIISFILTTSFLCWWWVNKHKVKTLLSVLQWVLFGWLSMALCQKLNDYESSFAFSWILSSITLFLALRKMYFHIPQNSQLLQTHPQMIIQPLIDLAPVLEAEHK